MKKSINLKLPKTAKVLDLKSARGHFAIRCLKEFDLQSIDCVEDDEYLLDTYKDNVQIKLYKTSIFFFFIIKTIIIMIIKTIIIIIFMIIFINMIFLIFI